MTRAHPHTSALRGVVLALLCGIATGTMATIGLTDAWVEQARRTATQRRGVSSVVASATHFDSMLEARHPRTHD